MSYAHRDKKRFRNGAWLVLFFVVFLAGSGIAHSQSDPPTRQLWFEFVPTYFIEPDMPLDIELGQYRSLNNERFIETSFTPVLYFSGALQINPFIYITPSVGFKIGYVRQDVPSNTLELTPFAGARLVVQIGRFQLSDYLRYEYRSFSYLGLSERDASSRIRNRIRVQASINKPRILDDTWYTMVDVESFAAFDSDIRERFKTSWRTRIGIGYRLNFTWAGQFIYGVQDSQDTITKEISESDNLISFTLMYTILE